MVLEFALSHLKLRFSDIFAFGNLRGDWLSKFTDFCVVYLALFTLANTSLDVAVSVTFLGKSLAAKVTSVRTNIFVQVQMVNEIAHFSELLFTREALKNLIHPSCDFVYNFEKFITFFFWNRFAFLYPLASKELSWALTLVFLNNFPGLQVKGDFGVTVQRLNRSARRECHVQRIFSLRREVLAMLRLKRLTLGRLRLKFTDSWIWTDVSDLISYLKVFPSRQDTE